MSKSNMKKRTLLIFLSVAVLFSLALAISAQTTETKSKVNDALSCLNNEIDDCSSLSLEEKIFSALATGKCVNEIRDESNDDECWPSGSCNVRTTSLATLALSQSGINTEDAEEWLLDQEETPTGLIWYLQIDSPEATSCELSYGGSRYTVNIAEDKSLSSSAGTCLARAQSNYWLRVSDSCYGTKFSITCDDQFTTTKLYQRQGIQTIYISENSKTSSGGDGGEIIEEFNSSCFGKGSCDYESSLWATLVLDSVEEDVGSYLPYLITMKDIPANSKYLPDAFLYGLTSSAEYREDLFQEQKSVNNQKYWDQNSGKGRYYDTALALLPFGGENPQAKLDTEDWLFDTQEESGCWNSESVRDTAFVLYSVFDSFLDSGSNNLISCEAAGFYCMSGISCTQAGGSPLSGYYCSSGVCCDEELTFPTCGEQGGEICSSGETCNDGSVVDSSDISSGEVCCIGGTCIDKEPDTPINDCENSGGICKSACTSNEEEISETCAFSSDVCCVRRNNNQGNFAWLWILSVLIVLVLLGIIFRDKIRKLFLKMTSKFKKKGGGRSSGKFGPGRPPGRPPSTALRNMAPKRPIPQTQKSPRNKKPSTEINSVLSKLREMGK